MADLLSSRHFYFHAEAHALVGKLELPFEEEIKRQAFVKLQGNLADPRAKERAERNYFSQHAKSFRLEGIISYASAHTQVSGHASDKHDGALMTLATSVVEDLNVLNVVSADRVVAQISTTHFPGQYSPHVTFLGTHFENLRISGHKAEPCLRLDVAGARAAGRDVMPVDQGTDLMKAIEAQYKRLKATFEALAESDRKKMRLTNADEWLADKYQGFNLNYASIRDKASDAKRNDSEWDGISCSLVENVEIEDISVTAADGKSIQIPPPAKTFGHVIHIPDFGNVFLAELAVKHNSYHLTMMRLEMGCLAAGSVSIATCQVNGNAAGGGGGNGSSLAAGGDTQELGRLHIEGIEDVPSAHAPDEPAEPPDELSPHVPAPRQEPARYTDLTLFSGHLFPGEVPEQSSRVTEDQALVPSEKYTLEVAIRLKRTGIDAIREAVRAVINPRQDKEELKIYVLAKPLQPEIEIAEPFASMKWPCNQDSEPAFFRLEVKRPVAGLVAQNQIEIRLYDGSLDLLDIVRLSVNVVDPGEKILLHGNRQSVTWSDMSGGNLRLDPRTPPRLLSIDVGMSAASSHYCLLFKFLTRNEESVTIPGSSHIVSEDLENLLCDVRDLWTEMVITNYSSTLTVTAETYSYYLNELRGLGVRAWRLLFGDRFAGRKGAGETLGDLLAAIRPREGAHIQITFSGVEDFVFPWSIVYPPDGSSETDPYQFWGARYQIEQVSAGPKDDVLTDEPVRIVFALDPQFTNSDAQAELLHVYESSAGGKLDVCESLSDKDKLFSGLIENPSAHLYYFYCHGYAPAGKNVLRRDGVQLLREKIEKLDDDSPVRDALETLLTLTGKMKNEPWIFIGNAEIKESQIRDYSFFWKRRPIVFLNACQSAELVPSSTSGFVRTFLDRNASAVIGTECPMTSVFASAFAKSLFDELLSASDVGTALWKARREFLAPDLRNPLGLAYTLYGRGTARLGSEPLITATSERMKN